MNDNPEAADRRLASRGRLEIRYCRQCRWLLRAAWMAQELLTTFDDVLGEVALVPDLARHFWSRSKVVKSHRGDLNHAKETI